MYKRLFAAMTALCLMLTLMPVSALAAEEELTTTTVTTVDGLKAAIDKGGDITLGDDITVEEALKIEAETVLNLNGFTLTLDMPNYNNYAIVVKADLTINGEGTVTVNAPFGIGTSTSFEGALTINGGAFVQTDDASYLFGAFGGHVEINGGTFSAPYCVLNCFDGYGATAEITGGTFETGENGCSIMGNGITVADDVEIGDHWFDASIGDTYYWTLADAVAEAENEDMITVLQDVSVPNGGIVLDKDKEITIDLNGKTISAEEDTVGDGVFHITAGTLILEDSSEGEGTVNGLGENNWSIGIWADGGDLIINGGSYTNVGAGDDDHYDLIYVSKTSQVEINGGTFKCHTPAWTLNQKDANRETSSIAVKGGSFYQFDPDNNSAEGEGTSFVAEGYVSEKDGDNYIVREYVASELTTDIGEIEFVIGVPTEFTFTTTANDDKDTMVIGTSNFIDAEAIEKLEYYEVQNDTWIELTGDFGPAAGFPMADATSKFRVTFKTAGDYSFTASMKHAETEAIVCSTVVEFTVTDPSAETPSASAPVTESYDVAIADSTNGRVAANTMRAGETSRVTLTVKADAGYVLESLTVTDKNGKEIKLTEKDGKYQFRMPASDVTVKAVFAAEADIEDEPFTDVAEDAYYHDAVLWAVENGITNGMTESTFAPNATCTRAQMVTFLWRAAGCPVPQNAAHSFTDLDKDAYYYNAVLWAVEKGITNGVSLDAFDPNGTVTRGQAMTFLWRMDGKTAADADHTFTDVEDGAYYEDAVAWGADEAITNGTSATTFSPDDACIRGQIVSFLYNYLVK